MRRIALVSFLALFTLTAGCSKSSDPPPEAAAPSPAPAIASPDVAVRQFLEAIRVGDHKQAEGLLTDLARQKTAEADLMVAPPGSPTATFQVAETEIIENQVAHVATTWTDIGDDGRPQSNVFVWALRREPTGWRIAGVAVELFPNQPPLLLDFEDPQDMMRKQQMAETEAQRRINSQSQQAGGVANTPAASGAVVPASGAAPLSAPPGVQPDPTNPAYQQGTAPQPGLFPR